VAELRLYRESALKALADSGVEGRMELERKLAMVKCNIDLTNEEKVKNIDMINFALNGGVKNTRFDVLKDIQAGLPDDIDKGDN
jgi:hypothetical protein